MMMDPQENAMYAKEELLATSKVQSEDSPNMVHSDEVSQNNKTSDSRASKDSDSGSSQKGESSDSGVGTGSGNGSNSGDGFIKPSNEEESALKKAKAGDLLECEKEASEDGLEEQEKELREAITVRV
jgi:hypothetical protein